MVERYSGAARFLHWLTAALILAVLVLGVWITQFEPKDEAFKFRLYNIHESLGVTVFVVVALRLLLRLVDPPPKLPARAMPAGMRFVAAANHFLLYVLLVGMPVIGLLNTNAWGFPLRWFGVLPIPSPIGKDEAIAPLLSLAHWIGAITLVCLLVLHIAGATYHGVVRRDGVLQRMV